MPQLGETVTEGTVTRWLKQVGDGVAVDDVLFEVSTEKVDTEVPRAHAGIMRAIYVQEGETVPIGTVLAVLADSADEEFGGGAARRWPGVGRAGAGRRSAPPVGRRTGPRPS